MLEVTDYPIILTGDFNMYYDSEDFAAIKEQDDIFSDTFTPFSQNLNQMEKRHMDIMAVLKENLSTLFSILKQVWNY